MRIDAGAFAGLAGVLDGYVGKRSARVLAHILGGETAVIVPLAKLTKSTSCST